ncbi:MAG: serine hydrolase [Pseudomonadota bacterium]
MRNALLPLCGALMALSSVAASGADIPRTELSQLGAAGVVKEVCSAVFVSGRDADEFLSRSSKFWMPPEDKSAIENVAVDRERRAVTLRLNDGVEATAVFIGSQGCVALAPGETQIGFTPVSAPSKLPAADTLDWPMGDRNRQRAWPKEIDRKGVERAVEQAFAPDAHTAAFLVLYKGDIIAERYGEDMSAQTPLPGWSVTKTLQATWAGVLENEGRLDLHAPAPIPEWAEPGDARGTITLADLLRMSAGLDCGLGGEAFDHVAWRSEGYTDYLYSFVGPDDAYDYAVSRPLGEEPRERGVYTNCQPHVVGRILKDELAKTGETLAAWPRAALYDRIGMRSMVVEPDRAGNPLTAAYSYATARDWARLGLLYAQDGVWNGERLLSHEFMALIRAPAPAWREPVYGGQVWLNLGSGWPWPRDTFSMEGIEGQSVVIVPSLDLVVVRLGHGVGEDPTVDYGANGEPSNRSFRKAAKSLVAAVRKPADPAADAVTGGVEAFFEALRRKDLEMLKSITTSDFVLFEDGRHWSAEVLMKALKSYPDSERDWIISQPRVEVSEPLAVVTYRNTGVFMNSGKRDTYEWTESATFRKEKGKWRMSFLHSTLIEPEGE